MRLTVLFLAAACLSTAQTPNADDKRKSEDKPELPIVHTSIVITASPVEPGHDQRNSEVFSRTLFSRDDQIFHVLGSGIDAGQHEGGGKSVEVRRFGFNLDHGGVNGGLKVLVDNVQQNQTTQGHGQGYLGSLKSLSPELVQEVTIINGPFSAEYGDFSGLGVVHIRLRESFPDQLTLRFQGGSFGSKRGFVGWSPKVAKTDALLAYEGSRTDGPFLQPLGYARDNVTGNYTRHFSDGRSLGFKFNAGRNTFTSSGQIPLDEVEAGRLDRFGSVDPTSGGRIWSATAGAYYRQERANGDVLKADAFASRSMFDLYSNFTFYLNDPVNGDAFQQHDSRLQEGANAQYLKPHHLFGYQALLTAGGNFHANQINVGLYPVIARVPTDVATRAFANVQNGAGYAQENVSLWHGRLQLGAGLRYDEFHFRVNDAVAPELSGARRGGAWQPKASLSLTPWQRLPLTFYANYGRGISTADARGIVQRPELPRIATTDFYQAGVSYRHGRFSTTNDVFWIDRSHEQVYIADDGSLEFQGPSRAYGLETKASVELTRKISLNAGITKVSNAFYLGTLPREYVDRAPHLVANAGLTVSQWRGWSGSLRMRAIDHYRLDTLNSAIRAGGNTVFDLGVARSIRRGVDLNFTIDNLLNRAYYETQNYFESRIQGRDPLLRIHGTPGYPRTIMAGITFRFAEK